VNKDVDTNDHLFGKREHVGEVEFKNEVFLNLNILTRTGDSAKEGTGSARRTNNKQKSLLKESHVMKIPKK